MGIIMVDKENTWTKSLFENCLKHKENSKRAVMEFQYHYLGMYLFLVIMVTSEKGCEM